MRSVHSQRDAIFCYRNSSDFIPLTRLACSCFIQSHTAGTPASVRTTFKNATYSAVIGDDLQFESDRPDWLEASLPIPAEFVKGNYGACPFPCVLLRN